MIVEGIWADNDDFRFVALYFEEIAAHPHFDVLKAVVGRELDGVGDIVRGVQLDIVCIIIKLETMPTNHKGKDIKDEHEGTKPRALGETLR